jgi:hypothetical protein
VECDGTVAAITGLEVDFYVVEELHIWVLLSLGGCYYEKMRLYIGCNETKNMPRTLAFPWGKVERP